MAKIQLKSDNITPYGGLFSIFKQFSSSGLRQTVDSYLGKRGKTDAAFTYGDIFASLFSSYLCGGDCIEDVMSVKEFWNGHDKMRVASSDTIERALRKLSCENTTYKTEDEKSSYDFNVADKMNTLLLKCLSVTGQIGKGDVVDLDFDHQFIPSGKKDAKYSYKKADGYFPGIAAVGNLIVGIENRDGNTNVRFRQTDTLKRIIDRLKKECGCTVRNFRADCGSFSKEIIEYVNGICEHFYIRASNCRSRRTEFMEHTDWTETEVGGIPCGVTSLKFDSFLADDEFRLVVQRTKISDENQEEDSEGLFGTEYVYRCILTNDWDNTERDIIGYYNKRGASERNFDCQNNDFGWAHLPFSYLKENSVFLIVTAILKNFYVYLLQVISKSVEGLDVKSRLKRFIRKFVAVPAKWIKSGRQEVLNLYTSQRIYLLL